MNDTPNGGHAPEWADAWLVPVLVQAGLLTQVDTARLRETGARNAWQACLQAGVASDEWILAAVAQRFRVKIADLEAVPSSAAALMPAELALRLGVVPLALATHGLDAACARPADPDLESALSFGVGKRVHLQLASPVAIERALARLYPSNVAGGGQVPTEEPTRELEEVLAMAGASDAAIQELVDALIVRGVRLGASDLHLEPNPQALVARYRVDGVLREVARIPRTAAILLLNRLKVMASLEVGDRLRPQDGRARATVNGRKVDLRVSSLPIAGLGEKIVVRILDTGPTVLRLDALGFDASELKGLGELLRGREGLVLVTGPSGSGKTTTLYAALRQLQSGKVNVATVEDRIEYRLDGISQVQVIPRAGLTFARTLQSIVQQDPDVILVGELPDRETANLAIQAARTGHLVLSTLHTNDVATALTRLTDIGVDLTALSAALRGVVAQRLIRRVCPSCASPLTLEQLPAPQQALLAGVQIEKLCGAVGCPECGGTGYRGRLVVAEVAIFDAAAQSAMAQHASVEELLAACRRMGMRSLWESGLSRVASGLTTVHELLDNVAAPPMPAAPAAPPANPAEGSLRQEDIDALVQKMLRDREAAAAASPPPAPAEPPPAPAEPPPAPAEPLSAPAEPLSAPAPQLADSASSAPPAPPPAEPALETKTAPAEPTAEPTPVPAAAESAPADASPPVAAAAPVAEATPTTAEPAPEPDTAPAAESPPSAPPPAASPTGSPEPETPAPEPASAPAAESAQPEAASAPAKPRVLLVDDHADARRALREGLVAEGLRVLEAADGETALEYIRRVRPDIVVLELALPRLDGFGVLRAVGEGQVPRVPCVVLTVQDDPDVASWASELGASDYLVKPLAARALAERLRSRLAAG